MSQNGANNEMGSPWWAKFVAAYGIPALLVAFLLGMIPGLPSPFHVQALERQTEIKALMNEHVKSFDALRRANVLTCQALWAHVPSKVTQCGAVD